MRRSHAAIVGIPDAGYGPAPSNGAPGRASSPRARASVAWRTDVALVRECFTMSPGGRQAVQCLEPTAPKGTWMSDAELIAAIGLAATPLVLVAILAVIARALERRRWLGDYHARPYFWGYWIGLLVIVMGVAIGAASIAYADRWAPAVLGAAAMWSLACLAGGAGILARTRWGWVLGTLASANPLVWGVNAVYGARRWAELGSRAGSRVEPLASGPEAVFGAPPAPSAPDLARVLRGREIPRAETIVATEWPAASAAAQEWPGVAAGGGGAPGAPPGGVTGTSASAAGLRTGAEVAGGAGNATPAARAGGGAVGGETGPEAGGATVFPFAHGAAPGRRPEPRDAPRRDVHPENPPVGEEGRGEPGLSGVQGGLARGARAAPAEAPAAAPPERTRMRSPAHDTDDPVRPDPGAREPADGPDDLFAAAAEPARPIDEERLVRELVGRWLITEAQADIVRAHARRRQIGFADAAVELNLVERSAIEQLRRSSTSLPVVVRPRTELSREVVVAYDAADEVTDQFLEIATQIQLRWLARGGVDHSMVSIVSPRRRDGRSFVAANLAVTFSRMGLRTLLIDGDLRHGRLHELFSLGEEQGLSSILAGTTPWAPLVALEDYGNLTVLGRGPLVRKPGDLFGRNTLNRLLQMCAESFDIVLIDTPSAAEAPEARFIAARTRGCVMVARRDQTPVHELQRLTQDLDGVGTTVIGTVLMKV